MRVARRRGLAIAECESDVGEVKLFTLSLLLSWLAASRQAQLNLVEAR
jgi:hypothetical protein